MEAAFSTECEIQMNELAILQSIARCCCEDSCGMNLNVPEIQQRLHISKPAVSYILNTLEKKKYITREIDPRDRRKISINVTVEGKLAAEQSDRKCEGMWMTLLTHFGESDMCALIHLLTRLTSLSECMPGESESEK
jgi:DNA-binding MarR family transcriptional regulator